MCDDAHSGVEALGAVALSPASPHDMQVGYTEFPDVKMQKIFWMAGCSLSRAIHIPIS